MKPLPPYPVTGHYNGLNQRFTSSVLTAVDASRLEAVGCRALSSQVASCGIFKALIGICKGLMPGKNTRQAFHRYIAKKKKKKSCHPGKVLQSEAWSLSGEVYHWFKERNTGKNSVLRDDDDDDDNNNNKVTNYPTNQVHIWFIQQFVSISCCYGNRNFITELTKGPSALYSISRTVTMWRELLQFIPHLRMETDPISETFSLVLSFSESPSKLIRSQ
jgi:hypothetical protein